MRPTEMWEEARKKVKEVRLLLEEAEGKERSAATLAKMDIDGAEGRLSPRQLQVVEGVRRRLTNKEIAYELHITERTVKYHISVILNTLGMKSRFELL